jgi:hypothetical protein
MSDNFNPVVVKGDTLTWVMNLANGAGNTFNLAGSTLSMQVRKSYHPSGLLVSYVLGVPVGSSVIPVDGVTGGLAASATGGMIYVTIGSAYTKSFSEYSSSFYDMQLQYPNNGGVVTLLRGRIETLPDVTKSN